MLAEKVTTVEYENSSALGKKKANNVSKWHLLVSYKAEYRLKIVYPHESPQNYKEETYSFN